MYQLLHELAVDVLMDLAETSQMTCSRNVRSASINTPMSRRMVEGLMMSLPADRLRSTPASSCCKRLRVPSQMTSVFPLFNPRRYIFYAGGSLAGAGYCRQCRRRPAILLPQLWQGCQVCVKISAQRPPRLAQFNAR